MRTRLLTLIPAAALFIHAATSAAAPGAEQSAIWTQHKVHLDLGPAPIFIPDSGPWQEESCGRLYDEVKSALLQLGSRVSDLDVDQRSCYGVLGLRSDEVTFSVLTPASNNAAGELSEGHWKTVELQGNCGFLEYLTQKVLPLFSARNVQPVSKADCDRLGVGVRAEVLVPEQ